MVDKRKKQKANESGDDDDTQQPYTSVICKLSRVCSIPFVVDEIQRTCAAMKQVQLEGWHLANLHVRRCLDQDLPFGNLDQTFFYQCSIATLMQTESRDRHTVSGAARNPELHRTLQLYRSDRETFPSYQPPSLQLARSVVNVGARMMAINAANMIALHFRRRLHQYVRFRYAPTGKQQLRAAKTRKLVASCYRVKKTPTLDGNGAPTSESDTSDWETWDDTSDPTELKLRKWLGMVPWEHVIRNTLGHFVSKLKDMLEWMETFAEAHPKLKGTRLYSLLPLGNSYAVDYIKLNASTLFDVFNRIYSDDDVKDFVERKLKMVRAAEWKRRPPTQQKDLKPFNVDSFRSENDTVQRKVFDVSWMETNSRKFAHEVKTNGYAASVLLKRPSVPKKKKKKKKKRTQKQKERRSKKRKINAGNVVECSQVTDQEEEQDDFTFARQQLPADYTPDVLIGIDPGMRTLRTAVSVGQLQGRRRRRRKWLQWRGRRKRRRKNRRYQKGQKIMEISTREYRHMARMNQSRRWLENLKMRKPWYRAVIQEMPSFKTASFKLYLARLDYFWMHLRFLLAFCAESSFLKHRFLQDRMKMKAIDTLAKRVVPIASPQVCTAYGDWSKRDGIKGHPSGPVKGFVKALKKRATVLPMDEFRTSKLCSSCHHCLKEARLLNKVKKKENDVLPANKRKLSKKELKEIDETNKLKKPELQTYKIVLKSTTNVLRCKTVIARPTCGDETSTRQETSLVFCGASFSWEAEGWRRSNEELNF
ncbi:hypothetical protein PHYBOEH_003917 [Phytophthora boehmeriae]|uniref:Uncharacterized protein n=1 Tax=Phytophthora boehmeriae TaxID=109152 RepID=A0A8T1WPI3_9STRA|nr:hypothetical protein PHYBOEH_003917 [Phytophthora boehmeriae]